MFDPIAEVTNWERNAPKEAERWTEVKDRSSLRLRHHSSTDSLGQKDSHMVSTHSGHNEAKKENVVTPIND